MSFETFYARGIAVGVPDIRTDCINFFFRGQEFSVPSNDILSHPQRAHYTGQFYEARIRDVRKLALKAAHE